TLTIYELDDSQVVDALAAAAQRGVAVRVLYNHYSFTNHDPNQSALPKLQAAGVQVKPASASFRVTHQKTLVADARTALIMSFNLRSSYFRSSRDFGYLTSDPGVVSEIESVFSADWEYAPVTPSNPSLVWSPTNSRTKIAEVIDGAARSLDIYNEELLDTGMLQAVEAAAKRGVRVRVLCPRLGHTGPDANQPGRDELNAAGAQAKVANGFYIHAKMVLADYGTGAERAYMGSENFSSTSLDRNRELGVLMTDQAQLSSLADTFQNDWDH
ncbi:MAG: cardiolipin synthase, partial [Elusimicrobia bacterium]|nr:cardiolipin synthase [Elusimicrobiota bacterium]